MVIRTAVVLTLTLCALLVTALVGHDYRYEERRLTIDLPDVSLDAILTTPERVPARGIVVVIHGDGAVDSTHDGGYNPWFEAAADAGFATLSWSKPGVGGSTGNWLHQSMADRADEASAVIDWALANEIAPTGTIVLWGASQAGWVLPEVVAARTDIDAVVAVSPAINWLRQGRFHLLAELDHDGAGTSERAQAIRVSDRVRELLRSGVDYATYLDLTLESHPMSADRWQFALLNYTSDAEAGLAAMAARDIPVLLMLAEHDRHVDIDETATTYRRLLEEALTMEYVDAAHSMVRRPMDDSPGLAFVTAIMWPRALFSAETLDSYRDFLVAQ